MTLGLATEQPPYADFRRHATFVPELADFALTERQLGCMLAEYGLDTSAGLGLGDVRILFQQLSNQSSHLTYQAVAQLYRILTSRQQRLQERISAERAAAHSYEQGRKEVEQAFRLNHADAEHPAVAAAAAAAAAGHSPSSSAPQAAPTPHADTGLARFLELLKQPAAPAAASVTARPMTAPASRATGLAVSTSAAAVRSSLQLSEAAMGSTAVIMTARDPLVILRETFAPPACEFPHIGSKLKGVREMMFTSDVKFCLNALKDIYKEWDLASEEKKAKESLKRGRSRNPGAVSTPAPASAAASGQLPSQGNIFLLLCAAGCFISLKDYAAARRVLAAAESQFPTAVLGVEHPYYYCIFLCQGIVHYYSGRFEDAIAAFEAARDIADLGARSTNDATASRNAGCCLNNIGVCYHMLARNSEAVASIREAVKVLCISSNLHGAAADGAVANLAKAVRISFSLPLRNSPSPASSLQGTRPASALPRMSGAHPTSNSTTGIAGLSATVDAAGGKLQAFLKQSITFAPVAAVASVPTWATRSDGVEAMRKAVAKAKGKGPEKKDAKKDGKKPAKKKADVFEITYPMTYYDPPTFGVANVSLAARKKAAKKKIAKP